ncbi:hypothetical protein SAY86_015122 [Trapa natans]|uniref:AP2/ERF domain-containing protein n=1 Tax=Trapa natans TaxID=22666 RepID=A0AAN7QGN4_TRANT|nr:hypothetical protein SAY86_015122 [Trapa natans]
MSTPEMVKTEQHSTRSSFSPPMGSPMAPSSSVNGGAKKKYKGVRMRSWGSWVSEIRTPNQKTRIWLGSYSTAEAAARAYDASLLCIKRSAAYSSLNFPDSAASYYGVPHDGDPLMSPKSIQRVAAAAASSGAAATPSPPPMAALSPSVDDSYQSTVSYSPPPHQHEEDFSQSHQTYYETHMMNESSMADFDSWCNFETTKYTDLMVDGGATWDFISSTNYTVEDFYNEEGDIRLWSFC